MFTYVVNTKHYSKVINIYIIIICDSHESLWMSLLVLHVLLLYGMLRKNVFFLLQKNVFKKLTWFLLFIKSLFLFATILK